MISMPLIAFVRISLRIDWYVGVQAIITIMRGTRKLVYENVTDMCAAVKELSFEAHRFQDCLTAILASACGAEGQKGLLELRTIEYINTSPLEWAKELDEIYELLGPASFLMKKVGDCANNQMSIESSLLPRCVTDEFPKAGTYQSRLIGGLRREATGSFSIRLWEWFWIPFIRSFLALQVEEKRPNASEEMAEDDFFTSISRNPYLGLLHRALIQLTPPLKNRLVNLLHAYLIDELLFKFRKRDGATREEQVKYKLKPHYLHLLYLLVLTVEPEEETVKTYYLFLQKIAENYSSTTVLSLNQNIRNMLRVWLTLATRTASVEYALIEKLKLANDKQGWFRLARCPIDKFEQSLEKLKQGAREQGRSNAAKDGIVRLLEKTGEWQPTYSMLAVIEQLLVYEQMRGFEYQRDREEQGGTLVRATQRILLALVEETGNKELIQTHHERFSRRIQQLYGRGVALNIDEKILSKALTSKPCQKVSTQRRSLLNNKSPRMVSVWAHPPQQNQFILLYQLMYWIAKQIDRIIPGQNHSEHPRINIRIFCNPIAFIVAILSIVFILRLI